tara:strand:+ start:283 stop:513 length:231 start_codon:yes stop_codon:yes gene_type:complete
MAIEEVIGNFTSFEGLEGAVGSLITTLQVVGGILGIVVLYWIIMSFINARKARTLKKILVQVEEINKKLDKFSKKK